MVCLDTTTLIDLSRARDVHAVRQIAAVLAEALMREEQIVTTRFNAAEFYVGVERLTGRRRANEQRRFEAALTGITVLEFDSAAAFVFARITAHLQEIGRPAGDMDVLIASVALAQGHALLTRNEAHFEDVPELQVVNY